MTNRMLVVSLMRCSAAAMGLALLAGCLPGTARPAAAIARQGSARSLLAVSAPGAGTGQETKRPAMSKPKRAALVRDFLAEKGYKPTIDNDGDVRFQYQGLNLYVGIDDDDDEYYQVVVPNFWSLDTAAEKLRAPSANTEVTRRVKAVKVWTVRGDTWCAVEAFYASAHDFLAVLERSIRTCYGGVMEFAKAIGKKPAAAASRR